MSPHLAVAQYEGPPITSSTAARPKTPAGPPPLVRGANAPASHVHPRGGIVA